MKKFKTYLDILAAAELTAEQFADQTKNNPLHVIGYKKVILICQVLNGKWKPNWKKYDQYKYFPYFRMQEDGFVFSAYVYSRTSSDVGSRLCYKSSELAEYAATTFVNEYKEFMLG